MHPDLPRNGRTSDGTEHPDGARPRPLRRWPQGVGQRLPDEREQSPAILRALGAGDGGGRLVRDAAVEPVAMNEDVLREVEQFLYREARLLDERRFAEWLALLTGRVRLWVGAARRSLP